jgi:hypothetical protein
VKSGNAVLGKDSRRRVRGRERSDARIGARVSRPFRARCLESVRDRPPRHRLARTVERVGRRHHGQAHRGDPRIRIHAARESRRFRTSWMAAPSPSSQDINRTKGHELDSSFVYGGQRDERPAGKHRQRGEQPRQRQHDLASRRAAWSSRTSSISRSRPPARPTSQEAEAPIGLETGLGTRAVATARNFSTGQPAQHEQPARPRDRGQTASSR